MFGKKLLNVVGLLFIGSRLISKANAGTLNTCDSITNMSTVCADGESSGTKIYCIDENVISEVLTGTGCAKRGDPISAAGIYVFEVAGANVGGSAVTLGGSGTVNTASNLVLYQCSGGSDTVTCTQTFGYITVNSEFCTIPNSGTPTCTSGGYSQVTGDCSATTHIGTLYNDSNTVKLCARDTSTTTSSADLITFDDGDYYVINSGSTVFTGSAEEVVVYAGQYSFTKANLSTDNYLVISKVAGIETVDTSVVINSSLTKVTLDGDKNYLVINGKNSVSNGNVGMPIVINNTPALVDLDGSDLCVDGSGIIWVRKEALCDADSDCSSYYDCTDGVCIKTTKNKRGADPSLCVPSANTATHCVNGYYITNSGGSALINDGSNGKLWHCNNGSCEAKTTFIGYFENKVSGKPEILCKVVSDDQQCNIVTIGYGETCSSVGDLITTVQDGTDYQICLATGEAGVALSTVNSEQLMISIHKTNGLYGINPNTIANDSNTSFSLVIRVDGNNIQVVKETTPIRYRYIKTGSTNKMVYTRTAAKLESAGDGICGTGSPFEYKLDQWTEALQSNTFAEFYVEGTNA